MNILFMIKTGESCVSLNGHIGPRIMFLIIEPGMVIMIIIEPGVGFEPSNPISCKHVSFWYPFLKPHLTTYHSNIGVQSKKSNRIRYIYLMRLNLGAPMGSRLRPWV